MKNALAFIKEHALISLVVLLIFLITVNTGIIYYNNYVLKETKQITKDSEQVIFQTKQVWEQVVRNVDIGMRGFALGKNEGLLGPLESGVHDKPVIIDEIRAITKKQGFTTPLAIDSLSIVADSFIFKAREMVNMVRAENMDDFMDELNADPGRLAWLAYSRNAAKITVFEESLNEKAKSDYESASVRIVIFQVVIFVIAIPALLFMAFTIIKDRKARKSLFAKLEKNNRDFLFNPGTDVEVNNENIIIDNSIKNFKTATNFISQVSNGNFAVEWEDITEKNIKFNTDNLAGELIQMRDKMKSIKAEDEVRNWISQGLANFSDVVRKNQDNLEALSLDILIFLTKYLDAQQSCLFVLTEDPHDEHLYLEMTACYAFNKKKFITKKLEIGQGLIGQAYLEGQSVTLTDMPKGYTEITSGLGHGTPTCLLIVPMKSNNRIEAVIEIAGFRKYHQYEVEFIEKVGEITASTLGTVKNTQKMTMLVDQFKTQAEQLRAQEEELRQNMEEMEATQEALRRQEND